MFGELSLYYYNRGLKKAKYGMISSALEDLGKALSCDLNNKDAWKLAGLCFYRLGRIATAIYCWQCRLYYGGADPSVAELIVEAGKTVGKIAPHLKEVSEVIAKKRYGRAATIFHKKIIPILCDHSEAYSYLGVLYMLAGNKRNAVKVWQKALRIDGAGVSTAGYIAYAVRSDSCSRR